MIWNMWEPPVDRAGKNGDLGSLLRNAGQFAIDIHGLDGESCHVWG